MSHLPGVDSATSMGAAARTWRGRTWTVATAGVLSVALISAAIAGGAGAATIALGASVLTGAAAWLLARGADRRFVVLTALISFGWHAVFAMGLDLSLFAAGRGGAMFLDDAGYVQIAADLARAWRSDRPPPSLDPSFDHNYVRVVAGLFTLVGPSTAAIKLVNTAFGVLSAVLAYRAMAALGLPGRRVALLLMLVFPSLLLWSSLALKDAYVLCFALGTVWCIAEFVRSGRFTWMLPTVGALVAFENTRPYLFVIMAVLWPLSLLFAMRARRFVSAALASAIAVALLVSTNALHYLNPDIITAPVYVRRAMAAGASSGFVEPLPVLRALPCDRYIVTVPGRTAAPDPKEIAIPWGYEVSIERTGAPNTVVVRAGDVIYVQGATPCPTVAAVAPPPQASRPPVVVGGTAGPSAPPPAATPSPVAVVISAENRNVISTPAPVTDDSLAFARGVAANVAHLPTGFAFLIGAPFPFSIRSTRDLVSLPEVALWYACIVFAVLGVRRLARTRQLRKYAYCLMTLAALTLLLSVVEGNVGTLVRHRAMIIPYVVMLAAVALSDHRLLPAGLRDPESRMRVPR